MDRTILSGCRCRLSLACILSRRACHRGGSWEVDADGLDSTGLVRAHDSLCEYPGFSGPLRIRTSRSQKPRWQKAEPSGRPVHVSMTVGGDDHETSTPYWSRRAVCACYRAQQQTPRHTVRCLAFANQLGEDTVVCVHDRCEGIASDHHRRQGEIGVRVRCLSP